jgi:hypothetical protein
MNKNVSLNDSINTNEYINNRKRSNTIYNKINVNTILTSKEYQENRIKNYDGNIGGCNICIIL